MKIDTRDFLESWGRVGMSGPAYYHSPPRCSPTPGEPHCLCLTNPRRNLPISVIRIEYRYKPSDNGSSDHSSTFRRLPVLLARPKLVHRDVYTSRVSGDLARPLLIGHFS